MRKKKTINLASKNIINFYKRVSCHRCYSKKNTQKKSIWWVRYPKFLGFSWKKNVFEIIENKDVKCKTSIDFKIQGQHKNFPKP